MAELKTGHCRKVFLIESQHAWEGRIEPYSRFSRDDHFLVAEAARTGPVPLSLNRRPTMVWIPVQRPGCGPGPAETSGCTGLPASRDRLPGDTIATFAWSRQQRPRLVTGVTDFVFRARHAAVRRPAKPPGAVRIELWPFETQARVACESKPGKPASVNELEGELDLA